MIPIYTSPHSNAVIHKQFSCPVCNSWRRRRWMKKKQSFGVWLTQHNTTQNKICPFQTRGSVIMSNIKTRKHWWFQAHVCSPKMSIWRRQRGLKHAFPPLDNVGVSVTLERQRKYFHNFQIRSFTFIECHFIPGERGECLFTHFCLSHSSWCTERDSEAQRN